uniref:peptidylprolyl isomerase n=1 Tax=uncultured marine thaumarchaeote AD1000_17_C04 TaxID=1455895 RepID=A0A075FQU0_9ARCH|nr:peptidyl-prolyl isomerase (PPIB, ppiB) [uncultured marine thaumarchaeote AD1000_17_C04]
MCFLIIMSSVNGKTLAIVSVVILLAVGFILFNPFNSNSNSSNNMSDRQIAVIETNFGTIVIQLFPDVAPGHVENFVKLAQDGFYDGTTFHRVIPGFMIQGGDPNSKDDDRSNDGQGGPGYTIKAEFSDKPHKRGILSMARAQDPNSAGSQFFIVVADSNFLDGQYTVFGEVIEGMEVADKIVNVEKDGNDNPREKVTMKVTIRS